MPTAPYPFLEDVLTTSRMRLNDMIVSVGGQTLTDNAAFTIYVINVASQKLQQYLVSQGYETLEDTQVLTAVPPCSGLDPALEVSLDWTGYNNGSAFTSTPALPQTLIRPLKLWERINSTVDNFNPMDEILGGMESAGKQDWNQIWEWRKDKIRMPGAKSYTDLKIRFASYFPDFVANNVTPFSAQQVPIMRSTDALSGFITAEMCASRGDLDAGAVLSEAKSDAMLILSSDSSQGRAVAKVSERGKMKDRYSGGGGTE